MLIYILYDPAHKRFADVCAYSLKHHSPTVLIKQIDINQLHLQPDKLKFSALLLAASHNNWFLCCRSELVFLYNPLELLEYDHPNKTVFKVAGFQVFDSPITLWNGEHGVRFDADGINQANDEYLLSCEWARGIGDIPNEWASASDHPNPKAILFDDIVSDGMYTDIWLGYYEAAAECSES